MKGLRKKTKNKAEQIRSRCVIIAKQINKIQANYKCDYCGAGKPERMVNSHHIFNEGANRSMSADLDNLICVCVVHHGVGRFLRGDKFGFHKTPAEAMEWFKGKYPKRYEILRKRARHTQQADEMFWTKKLEELKGFVK